MLLTELGPVSENVRMLLGSEVPIYLIEGAERLCVVDTGLSFLSPELVKQLEEAGADKKPLYILLTHSHFDHVGGIGALKRAYPDAKVISGETAADIFKKPAAMTFIRGTNENFVKALNLEENYPGFDFSIPETIDVDITVKEGDVIDLGGDVRLRVYEVPGHSRCSMAYLLEPDLALFSGEAAGFYDGSGDVISEGLSDYSAYLDGLEKIRDLRPKTICLPHNGVLGDEDAETYFDLAIKCGREFRDKILKLISDDVPEDKMVEDIVEEKYRGLIKQQPLEVFIINLRAMIKAIRREM